MSIFIDGRESRSDIEGSVSQRLFKLIYGTGTRAGKLFDVVLLWAIVISVIMVMMESVQSFRMKHGDLLRTLEWGFTILFTIEYVMRVALVKRPLRYVFSFFGVIDLVSILPSYLGLFFAGGHSLMVIRSLRLLRVARIFKLVRYLREARMLGDALMASRGKVAVFMLSVFFLTVIMGTIMYMVEDASAGFTSIPRSIYWSIVTITTVGYGDIAPQTWLGQLISSAIMLLGYAIIAVPTGIVTMEVNKLSHGKDGRECQRCGTVGHSKKARFCRVCGERLLAPMEELTQDPDPKSG